MSVMRNLLTNAAEAIGKGPGVITVTVSEEKDADDPYGAVREYRIAVRDSGPGISKEAMNDVFMEGYSTKFDSKTGNIQRGLGLSLVKDYIENDFGGSISIESEPGAFTEFRICIPADTMGR